MSVGLYLLAKRKAGLFSKLTGKSTPEKTLREMEAWIHQNYSNMRPFTRIGIQEEKPTLFCCLHPAAENLYLSLIDTDGFTASANTSTVGPGYHIFVCDFLHKLGDAFNLVWQPEGGDYLDETGYFFARDPERVFSEMTLWLNGVARMFFDGTLEGTDDAVRLAMPVDCGFKADARAITPMGPRNTEWLERASKDGNNGRDFFAWWTPGFTAEYFLGRALTQMWTDVRWRKPVTDSERITLNDVAESLAKAHQLDPTISCPWAEWAEILTFLNADNDQADFVRSQAQGQGSIGYRRGDVGVQLPGNWWITVPGSFTDFEGDKDHNYCAVDPPREVWVTSFTFKGKNTLEGAREEMNEKRPELVHEDESYLAWANITKEKSDRLEYFSLMSSNVGLGHRAICQVVFTDPTQRDWAVKVWKSLIPPKHETS